MSATVAASLLAGSLLLMPLTVAAPAVALTAVQVIESSPGALFGWTFKPRRGQASVYFEFNRAQTDVMTGRKRGKVYSKSGGSRLSKGTALLRLADWAIHKDARGGRYYKPAQARISWVPRICDGRMRLTFRDRDRDGIWSTYYPGPC